MLLPESVPQHGNTRAAPLIVVRRDQPSLRRVHTERREITPADINPSCVFHDAARRQIELCVSPRENAGENVLPRAQRLPERVRVDGRGLRPKPCVIIPTCTSSPGRCTGSSRNITVSIRLKIAVLAPMPRARVITATAVKPGDLRSMRAA